jgi:hypothetical protein
MFHFARLPSLHGQSDDVGGAAPLTPGKFNDFVCGSYKADAGQAQPASKSAKQKHKEILCMKKPFLWSSVILSGERLP